MLLVTQATFTMLVPHFHSAWCLANSIVDVMTLSPLQISPGVFSHQQNEALHSRGTQDNTGAIDETSHFDGNQERGSSSTGGLDWVSHYCCHICMQLKSPVLPTWSQCISEWKFFCLHLKSYDDILPTLHEGSWTSGEMYTWAKYYTSLLSTDYKYNITRHSISLSVYQL